MVLDRAVGIDTVGKNTAAIKTYIQNQLKEDLVIKSNPVESVDKDERESNPLNLITFLEKKGVTTEAIAEQANIAKEAGRELLQEESLNNKTTKSEEAR